MKTKIDVFKQIRSFVGMTRGKISTSNAGKKMARVATWKWVLVLVSIGLGSYLVADLSQDGQLFNVFSLNPGSFQPIKTTSFEFDVYGVTDGGTSRVLLGTIIPGETIQKYSDPVGVTTHPAVGCFHSSSPYPSDADGNYIGAEEITVGEKRVFDGDVYFRHVAYFSYDVGARTYSAIPALRTDTVRSVTPVAGVTIEHRTGGPMRLNTYPGSFGYVPQGTMIATVELLSWPWKVTPYGNAQITQSLEPIDYDGERANNAQPGYTFNDAINRLCSNYGNSEVVVIPRVVVSAVNNFESYTYSNEATLSNGTKVTVTLHTKSALVGFEDAYVKKLPWADLIPKAYTEQFDRSGIKIEDSEAEDGRDPYDDEYESPGTDPLQASLEYDGDITMTGGNIKTRKIEPLGTWTSLDSSTPQILWNEIIAGRNSLPEQVRLEADFALQPQTTLKVASMRASWMVASWFGLEPVNYQSSYVNYKVPYAIKIDNVGSMYTFTFKVDLFTSNEVLVTTSNGMPVNTDELLDYDVGSIVNNPSADNMQFTVESKQWWEGLFDFSQVSTILGWIFAILGAVATIFIISKIRSRSR